MKNSAEQRRNFALVFTLCIVLVQYVSSFRFPASTVQVRWSSYNRTTISHDSQWRSMRLLAKPVPAFSPVSNKSLFRLHATSNNMNKEQKSADVQAMPSAPLKIIIAGAPAAGKGTQCEVIKDRFGVVHLSTGDILRAAVKEGTELGKKAKDFMDNGQLVPDELIIDVICERLGQQDCQKNGWLLDGFPRTKAQADALNNAGMVPDCFVLLDVPEDVLVERVTGRRTDPVTGKIYHMKFSPPENEEIASRLVQRSDDTEEKIKVRYREFQSHIDAIRSSYEDCTIWVDGAAKKDDVSKCISMALREVKHRKLYPATEDVSDENEDDDNNRRGGVSGKISKAMSSLSPGAQTAAGMAFLISLDRMLQSFFRANNIAFPSSLAGMVALFASMTAFHTASPQSAEKLFHTLSYAVGFVKTWLVLFFVPPLVVLPLKLGLIKGMEVKLASIVALGAFASLASSGLIAKSLQQKEETAVANTKESSTSIRVIDGAPAPKLPGLKIPFLLSVLGYVVCVFTSPISPIAFLAEPSLKLYEISSTVTGYILGTKLPTATKKFIHPIMICAMYTIAALGFMGPTVGENFPVMLGNYFGSSNSAAVVGSGDLISSLLGPSILCFGLQLFQYREVLMKSIPVFLGGTAASALFGLISSAVFARLSKLQPMSVALAPLTRCITSPLALAGATLTGADASLAAFLVVVTGMLGASFGESFLQTIGVSDPLSVGLSMGASAHGLGTAALASDPLKFAASVVSMTLTGLWTVALLSQKPIRTSVAKLAFP